MPWLLGDLFYILLTHPRKLRTYPFYISSYTQLLIKLLPIKIHISSYLPIY